MSRKFKRIFIGGTGRSGTTILLHSLYRHHQIYAVPIESKFIVEADGLSVLADQLTTRFSPSTTFEGVARLTALLEGVLTGARPRHFLTDIYGKQEFLLAELYPNYAGVVRAFVSAIESGYFEERAELIEVMRGLVDGLFKVEARKRGKIAWAEKTPGNLFEMPFLTELFPDRYFIHIKRDPRGVFDSLWRKGWVPHDLEVALPVFASALRRWVSIRDECVKLGPYKEITLEEMSYDTHGTLKAVTDFVEIDPFTDEEASSVADVMGQYWGHSLDDADSTSKSLEKFRQTFTPQQVKKIERFLAPYSEAMGYTVG